MSCAEADTHVRAYNVAFKWRGTEHTLRQPSYEEARAALDEIMEPATQFASIALTAERAKVDVELALFREKLAQIVADTHTMVPLDLYEMSRWCFYIASLKLVGPDAEKDGELAISIVPVADDK